MEWTETYVKETFLWARGLIGIWNIRDSQASRKTLNPVESSARLSLTGGAAVALAAAAGVL